MHRPSRRPDLTTQLLAGIFVGGRARRMRGVPKGLLPSPDPELTVIERLIRTVRAVSPDAGVVLVGEASAYAALGLPSVADEPAGLGPMGGLVALLEHAAAEGRAGLLVLACDLPYVSEALLARLLATAPDAAAVVPRARGVLQPLCARYSPNRCLPVARAAVAEGERALFRVVERLGAGAAELAIAPDEAGWFDDWDTPEDVTRRG